MRIASFIKYLDTVVGPEVVGFLTVYVDDILITSQTIYEHLWHLEYVLSHLKNRGLMVSWEKSKFCRKEMNFLAILFHRRVSTQIPIK